MLSALQNDLGIDQPCKLQVWLNPPPVLLCTVNLAHISYILFLIQKHRWGRGCVLQTVFFGLTIALFFITLQTTLCAGVCPVCPCPAFKSQAAKFFPPQRCCTFLREKQDVYIHLNVYECFLPTCMTETRECLWGSEEGIGTPTTGVRNGCEPPDGCQESTPSPLKKGPVSLTAEPPLQPPTHFLEDFQLVWLKLGFDTSGKGIQEVSAEGVISSTQQDIQIVPVFRKAPTPTKSKAFWLDVHIYFTSLDTFIASIFSLKQNKQKV